MTFKKISSICAVAIFISVSAVSTTAFGSKLSKSDSVEKGSGVLKDGDQGRIKKDTVRSRKAKLAEPKANGREDAKQLEVALKQREERVARIRKGAVPVKNYRK